jgi:hypothetical protein
MPDNVVVGHAQPELPFHRSRAFYRLNWLYCLQGTRMIRSTLAANYTDQTEYVRLVAERLAMRQSVR